MANFRDLVVWQKAMRLVIEIYQLVRALPNEEKFGLCDQMRRAAVSIPSNIAEGQARKTPQSYKDFSRFLLIAQGSRAELETQIEICIQLQYITIEQAKEPLALCEEISRMLRALIQTA